MRATHVAVLLQHRQDADDDLRARSDEDLSLAGPLGIAEIVEALPRRKLSLMSRSASTSVDSQFRGVAATQSRDQGDCQAREEYRSAARRRLALRNRVPPTPGEDPCRPSRYASRRRPAASGRAARRAERARGNPPVRPRRARAPPASVSPARPLIRHRQTSASSPESQSYAHRRALRCGPCGGQRGFALASTHMLGSCARVTESSARVENVGARNRCGT